MLDAKLDNFPLTARLIIKLVRECEAREKFIRSSELENGSFLYKIYKSRVCMSTFSKMLNVHVRGKKIDRALFLFAFFTVLSDKIDVSLLYEKDTASEALQVGWHGH